MISILNLAWLQDWLQKKTREAKSKISPKKIKETGAIVCIIITLGLLIWGSNNFYRYSETQKRVSQRKVRLAVLEKDFKDLEKKINGYREERARLEESLFSDKDIATFLDKMSEYANSAQISIKDMRAERSKRINPPEEILASLPPAKREAYLKDKEKEPSLYAMPIKMVVEGNFPYLINFLVSLEKYRQLLTLSDVDIERKAYPVLEGKFTLRLYSLKELYELAK